MTTIEAVTEPETYDLNHVWGEATQLCHLLGLLDDFVTEQCCIIDNMTQDDIGRISALAGVAREAAERIRNKAADHAGSPGAKLVDLRRVIEINEWTATEFRRGQRSADEIVAEAAQRLKALS